MLLVDTRDGSVLQDSEAKERAAARHDYGLLADRMLVPVERHHLDVEAPEDIAAQQRIHGWGSEDVKIVVATMAETGAEPVFSMGDDIPIAALGRTPRAAAQPPPRHPRHATAAGARISCAGGGRVGARARGSDRARRHVCAG